MDFSSVESSQSSCKADDSAVPFGETTGDLRPRALSSEAPLGEQDTNPDVLAEERLAERTRIARELHDTLLQGILAASMRLHLAVDQLPADSAQKRAFLDVAQFVDRVVDQSRCVLEGLRSPGTQLKSLAEAFARVPNDLGFQAPADFRVVVLGKERQLKAAPLDEVYRIGCEAIVNACRHSRARKIEAEVEYRRSELRVAVRDNGCGIAPQDLVGGRKGHWGLRGMRERAERIGARLQLLSGVARGTEIELSVPGRVVFE